MSGRKTREEIDRLLPTPLTDEEWHLLVEKRWIAEYEAGETPLEPVVAEVKKLRRVFQRRERRSGSAAKRPDRALSYVADDMLRRDARARAVSEVVAHQAAARAEVREFRHSILNDRLLTAEQARLWITKERANKRNRRPAFGAGNWSVYRIPEGLGDGDPLTPWDRFYDLVSVLTLWYSWFEESTQYFVLTGQTPFVHPILIEEVVPVLAFRRIRLSVDLVVPPDDLAAYYKRIRRVYLSQDLRRQSDRQLSLAAFWGTRPSGERSLTTMRRWNDKCSNPRWRYEHLSNFVRDARKAVGLLTRKK